MGSSSYLDAYFTASHEWIATRGNSGRVGISKYAAEQYGDMVFLELPEIGKVVKKGDEVGVVESVKAASEVCAPVSCIVTAVNNRIADDPGIVNKDPHGEGWFFEAEITNSAELAMLNNYIQYKSNVVGEIEHIIFLDESNRLHYLPAVRGEDGRIIVGGEKFESSIARSLISARAFKHEPAIEEFEELINAKALKERAIQDFFERHPEFLLGAEYDKLYPQVILKPSADESLIPDFILKPLAGVSYGPKIVELKLPTQNVVKNKRRREGLYANIHEAVAQLRAYARFFDEQANREYVQKVLGFTAYKPRLALIVGKEISIGDEQVKADILNSLQPIELLTYNHILARYRRLTRIR